MDLLHFQMFSDDRPTSQASPAPSAALLRFPSPQGGVATDLVDVEQTEGLASNNQEKLGNHWQNFDFTIVSILLAHKVKYRRWPGFKQKLLVNRKQHLPEKSTNIHEPMKGVLVVHRYFK